MTEGRRQRGPVSFARAEATGRIHHRGARGAARKARSSGSRSSGGRLGLVATLAAALLAPGSAQAHVTDRAVALLLPTDIWAPAGAAVVGLTALILALAPPRFTLAAARARLRGPTAPRRGRTLVSLLSALWLLALVGFGLFGPRDPMLNLAPLAIWCGLYVIFPIVQVLCGDLWSWLNPWIGLHDLLRPRVGPPRLPLPASWGAAPGALWWLVAAGFILADPAPADPARVAVLVLSWWALHLVLGLIFGPDWYRRGEGFGAWLSLFSATAAPGVEGGRLSLALPGGRLALRAGSFGGAALVIVALGAGSFDGFNETFVWLSMIGVNPLAFPGRSAVIGSTLVGLVLSILLLAAVFLAFVAAGHRLARGDWKTLPRAAARLAWALAPIAVGYHLAHYLTVLLVQGQYLLAALNDPLHLHQSWLGIGYDHHQVTTSFFFHVDTVRPIWLTQAACIVGGHVIGVFAAHAAAVEIYGDSRQAALSQIPIAAFMVVYTLFGLWLLAAPTGA